MKNFIIKGKPVYSLTDCLNKLTFEAIQEIASNVVPYDKYFDTSSKETIIDMLCSAIPTHLFEYLEFRDVVFFNFLLSLMAKHFDIIDGNTNPISKPPDPIRQAMISLLARRGFLFVFEPDIVVVPLDVSAVLREYVIRLQAKNELPGKYAQITLYGELLTCYYGVCPTSQFLRIWNLHNNQPAYSTAEIDALLQRSSRVNYFFWHNNETIFHNKVYDDNEALLISKQAENKPWYIPTANDIYRFQAQADKDTYPRLYRWLKEKLVSDDEAENVLEEIVVSLKKGASLNEIFDSFVDFGIYINTALEAQQISMLLTETNNNTPLWVNRGFTPNEIALQTPQYASMQHSRGKGLSGFAMTSALLDQLVQKKALDSKADKKTAKTGRNDPCPCGSGKKFKRCCGK